jgi:serine/threonine-protein kinase
VRLPDPFADRYTNLRFVGRGGFGVVYRAWDLEMERDIALKLLNPELAADDDWRKRFRQEATAASKFTHPNITIVFDRGEYQSQPFIVMELVEGEPCSRVIEQRVPLTDPERLFLIEQLR